MSSTGLTIDSIDTITDQMSSIGLDSSPATGNIENASSTIENLNGSSLSSCMKCNLMNNLITQKDAEIKTLRNQLKKARQKLWYIEKVKENLKSEFSELKKQSLVNEELCETLEVCNKSTFL